MFCFNLLTYQTSGNCVKLLFLQSWIPIGPSDIVVHLHFTRMHCTSRLVGFMKIVLQSPEYSGMLGTNSWPLNLEILCVKTPTITIGAHHFWVLFRPVTATIAVANYPNSFAVIRATDLDHQSTLECRRSPKPTRAHGRRRRASFEVVVAAVDFATSNHLSQPSPLSVMLLCQIPFPTTSPMLDVSGWSVLDSTWSGS